MKVEKIFIAILLAVLIFILWDLKCNGGKIISPPKPIGLDTIIITKDSTVYRDTGSTKIVPTLIKEYVPVIRFINESSAVSSNPLLVPANSSDSTIVADYHIARQYKDTIEVNAGKIMTDATVFKNQLQELTISTDLRTIERTTTIVANPLPKSYPLISGGVFGGYVWGAKIGGGWKDKRDRIFKIDYNRTVSGQNFIGGEVLLPVRFKRKN